MWGNVENSSILWSAWGRRTPCYSRLLQEMLCIGLFYRCPFQREKISNKRHLYDKADGPTFLFKAKPVFLYTSVAFKLNGGKCDSCQKLVGVYHHYTFFYCSARIISSLFYWHFPVPWRCSWWSPSYRHSPRYHYQHDLPIHRECLHEKWPGEEAIYSALGGCEWWET